MTVSAIIAVYKPDISMLNKCIDCALPQVDEIIICADMDSPWPLVGLREDPKIKLIRHPQHATGYGRKATLGAMNSSGDVLAFLNDDLFWTENVVKKCLEVMVEDFAVVTHTLKYENGLIQYAGKFRNRGMLGFAHEDHNKQASRHTKPIEQESACGASMFVRRDAFMSVNGFDENFGLFSEDDDLVLRIRQAGWRVIFTPLVDAIHLEHSSMKKTPGWMDILHKSNRTFASKWGWYFRKNPNPSVIGTFDASSPQESVAGRDGAIIIRRKIAGGDVLLTTPLITALKRENPNRQIFVETDYPEMFRGNPNVTRAKQVVSLPNANVPLIDLTMAYENRPHLNYLDAYAEVAGIKITNRTPEIFTNAAEQSYAIRIFGREHRWAIINAGNPCENRVWPIERYAAVISHLHNLGFKVANVGKFAGPKDCDLDLTKQTTLHQMAALIDYCSLFIGIDSLPLHIACATDSTAIGLFGVTSPEKVLSNASNVWSVTSDKNHPHTGARHRIVTDDSVKCATNPMETITSEQVNETIDRCIYRI